MDFEHKERYSKSKILYKFTVLISLKKPLLRAVSLKRIFKNLSDIRLAPRPKYYNETI